jgi:hypothetical protein
MVSVEIVYDEKIIKKRSKILFIIVVIEIVDHEIIKNSKMFENIVCHTFN